ncbi:MAG: 16S rRNA (cytosine(1402)-N(4))-methyltransferase RsmH [Patescibacteria group bacterium]
MHTPVLVREVLDLLDPQEGDFVVDCTLGFGGHAEALLERVGEKGKLIGLDADPRNLELAKEKLKKFRNVELIHANFRELGSFVKPESADVILFDLGISSPHLDDPSRGFSFQNDGPLDMRFDDSSPLTAAGILNGFTENQIANVLYEFGEVRSSRKVARGIVERRRQQKFERTSDLVEAVEAQSLLPQIFQALRIAVNDELNTLTEGLNAALKTLKSTGRMAVISFHSLEDRINKNFFREHAKAGVLEVLTKKPIIPSSKEIDENQRSRSAKLRAARKL